MVRSFWTKNTHRCFVLRQIFTNLKQKQTTPNSKFCFEPFRSNLELKVLEAKCPLRTKGLSVPTDAIVPTFTEFYCVYNGVPADSASSGLSYCPYLYSQSSTVFSGCRGQLPRDYGVPAHSAGAKGLPRTVDPYQPVYRREYPAQVPYLRWEGLPGTRRTCGLRRQAVYT